MKFLKQAVIFSHIVSTLLLSVLGLNSAIAQQDYKTRAGVVYKNIYQYFYDSSRQLYIEKTVLKKDEKLYSYLWPICALIQAANEAEVLYPEKEYMKPV